MIFVFSQLADTYNYS